MIYSLSSIKQSLKRAHERHVAESKQKKSHKSVGDVLAEGWDTASHVLVAFFVVVVLSLCMAAFETSLSIPVAHAAGGYEALVVDVTPSEVTVESGEAAAVRVTVKNIGTSTWVKEGAAYTSLYTWEPKYHVSPYRGPSWWSDHQTGALTSSSIAPGETGVMEFYVYGPPNFEGSLTETFRLAAEDTAWFDGGVVKINMNVVGEGGEVVEVDQVDEVAECESCSSTSSASDASGYDGMLLIRSAKEITARANEVVTFKAGFKNTGDKAWSGYEVHEDTDTMLATTSDTFYHSSWSSNKIAKASGNKVVPGDVEFVEFSFRAPHRSGQYNASFQLVVDGVELENAVVNIPVEVTSNASDVIDAEVDEDRVVLDGEQIEEPRVRVGIDQVTGEEVIFSANTEVTVVESDIGYERFVIPAEQPIRVRYSSEGKYALESGDIKHLADSYLRFEGTSVDTIFTVSSYSDVRSWNTSLNDNTFRDTLEIRYNSKKDRVWLINELPIEYYLYGLDETSNWAPEEYHKALATAARTYATYMWEHKTKYAGEYIDMRSTTYDQVYHGYGAEIRRPNFTKQVDESKGITIQYEGETIVAAYYSRSNGRTRDWADVWGRDVPYAVSVEVPCEVGKTEWGHGVGMSAGGAVCFAEDGMTYDEILKYFYTGVDLVRRW